MFFDVNHHILEYYKARFVKETSFGKICSLRNSDSFKINFTTFSSVLFLVILPVFYHFIHTKYS